MTLLGIRHGDLGYPRNDGRTFVGCSAASGVSLANMPKLSLIRRKCQTNRNRETVCKELLVFFTHAEVMQGRERPRSV